MADLSSLIEKLEQAREGSRELDVAIQRQLANNPEDHWYDFAGKWTKDDLALPYTTSLDAALTLVPEGFAPIVMLGGEWAKEHMRAGEPIWEAAVCEDTSDFERTYIGDVTGFDNYGSASNGALALCIASLKARKEMDHG